MTDKHNNAPAVPQGEPVAWMVTNGGPHSLYFSRMYADDAVWMAKNVCYKKSIPNDFQIHPLYSTPAPAPAQGEPFGYFRAEPFGWTDCSEDAEGAIALYEHPAHEKHWTENEPVRLPSARTDRVYLAGPMTGIAELNFPAFNQEAERLRAEGLQVLNPADHGIVDGADWADYLRHDIAGLASCERIHLLRGWTKSKGACLEMTIAKALGMTVTYQVDAEIEHNNAPAVPQTVYLVENRTCLLAYASREDADKAVASMPASVGGGFLVSPVQVFGAPAPAPAQEVGESVQLRGLDDSSAMLRVRTILESKACYLAGSTIAEIVAAAQPAQEVGLTDDEIAAIWSRHARLNGDEAYTLRNHVLCAGRDIIAALRAKGAA